MSDEMEGAIAALERAKAAKLAEVEHQFNQMIAQLQGTVLVIGEKHLPKLKDFHGLGIVDAAKRWLEEVGEPRSTREIADALIDRGMQTKSKNFTATVYATLTNSGDVKRNRQNKWEIVNKEGRS